LVFTFKRWRRWHGIIPGMAVTDLLVFSLTKATWFHLHYQLPKAQCFFKGKSNQNSFKHEIYYLYDVNLRYFSALSVFNSLFYCKKKYEQILILFKILSHLIRTERVDCLQRHQNSKADLLQKVWFQFCIKTNTII